MKCEQVQQELWTCAPLGCRGRGRRKWWGVIRYEHWEGRCAVHACHPSRRAECVTVGVCKKVPLDHYNKSVILKAAKDMRLAKPEVELKRNGTVPASVIKAMQKEAKRRLDLCRKVMLTVDVVSEPRTC